MATDAQGRQLSDDGYYYWDGSNWQPVDTSGGNGGSSAGGDGSSSSGGYSGSSSGGYSGSSAGGDGPTSSQQSTLTDAQGRQLSGDGNYYWDGSSWQPVGQSTTPAGSGSADSGDGYQELTVSVLLHAVGEMTMHALGGLLALVIDVVSIPGDVALKPADPPPSNPTKTGPFIAACAYDGHSIIVDEPGGTVLSNGMWVWNATFDSQSDAQAKADEHGSKFCPDNGRSSGVLAVSEISG